MAGARTHIIIRNDLEHEHRVGGFIISSIKDLVADGPDPQLKEKLMLFGQFVGDWDILEARYPQPDGTEIKRRGEIHFS